MREALKSRFRGEIIVDSDRGTFVALIVLFVFCGLLLAQDIRHSFYGVAVPLRGNSSLFDRILTMLLVIYCFLAAFQLPKTLVRIACALIGARLLAKVLLFYLHPSIAVLHAISIAGLITSQISMLLLLTYIVVWFRSVVGWNSSSKGQVRGE